MAVLDCIGGVVPPICTPLTDTGEVDRASLLSVARYVLGNGARGVFALGSTGEATYLDNASRKSVVESLQGELGSAVPLLVGVVESTADRVIEHARYLDPAPETALVVTAPFYAKASDAEITRHFERISAALDRPVVAYNIPVNVGYAVPTAVLVDLVERGVVVGIKDSSPDLGAFREAARALSGRTDCLLFTGSDILLDAALQVGANGVVAGLANVAPAAFVAALASYAAGDSVGLTEAQQMIITLTRLYRQQSSVPGLNSTQLGSIKTAMLELGVISSDNVSAPMIRSSLERRQDVREILADAGLVRASA